MRVTLLSGAAAALAARTAERQQKDELCGAFAALLALRAAGIDRTRDGHPLDQDAVAEAAATTISLSDNPAYLPPGAAHRRDYRLDLPQIGDEALAGTSAAGVAHAVTALSDGQLAVVPVAGPWSAERVARIVDLAAALPEGASLIANVDTGEFAPSRPTPLALLSHLEGGVQLAGEPDWRVGHFVLLLGTIAGAGGSLVFVADSYRELGWDGLHAQPLESVAAALTRSSRSPGGVLVVVASDAAGRAEKLLDEAGFELRLWDNGTPYLEQATV